MFFILWNIFVCKTTVTNSTQLDMLVQLEIGTKFNIYLIERKELGERLVCEKVSS